MVRKQLKVGGTGDAVQMDFYPSVTEFRAKADDLNRSAALNQHASRRFHGQPSDCYPVFAMLYMQ